MQVSTPAVPALSWSASIGENSALLSFCCFSALRGGGHLRSSLLISALAEPLLAREGPGQFEVEQAGVGMGLQ